ncbi:hypothetical protein AMTR_s00089p00072770 [Amborella trichopoda]|uniref:Uncharacterized protein n=1 Tax=Amborella trichopoda TaxID=13333 RepID=W1P2G4_AMBTC|nr:hypothetical protein AMTR_s00089p00072770 [Amborella trichopoda]
MDLPKGLPITKLPKDNWKPESQVAQVAQVSGERPEGKIYYKPGANGEAFPMLNPSQITQQPAPERST